MRWVGLKYSLVSSLVTEYRDLLFLAAFTFCSLCAIHFFSTVIFYQGELSDLFSGGVIIFSSKGQ
ncbi:MAG: hypothetical protein JL50_08000 [Peptococcaceae bacterium BICA1-7]|nr:MAG: hypothetical protein JL50_08000 [Peptococcaceae bacterium BICA1-7]HBV97499.1 hypothetical protein [Desulfotomaculum sp.]